MLVYMNLYRQGWYHRAGKPGTLAFHPGDLYPTHSAAVEDIDHDAPFIATVPVDVPDDLGVDFSPYGVGSLPVPLRESRRAWENGIDYDPDPAARGLPIVMGYQPRFDAIAAAEEDALHGVAL